ncbi:Hypothetical protein XCAW_02690 [Xanthomonas citri subsp. citri Aw12879]|uniref:Uncharacterized protein n=1 Tax=Xanthomonas axonopodis pv. citri (strain 306) TaxID=190486 RepID=A0AAI7ZER3_XANAC|nr:hypothetical protein XAC1632 [Xanthomonas citri pv. citri str. 306]AGI08468.1 Hypothetical protein XCAW_02690 [Xanthomonas citri subsp. citri Aw12879]
MTSATQCLHAFAAKIATLSLTRVEGCGRCGGVASPPSRRGTTDDDSGSSCRSRPLGAGDLGRRDCTTGRGAACRWRVAGCVGRLLVLRTGRCGDARCRRAAVSWPQCGRLVVCRRGGGFVAVDVVGIRQRLLALGAASGPDCRPGIGARLAIAEIAAPRVAHGIAQPGRCAGGGICGGVRIGVHAAWRD